MFNYLRNLILILHIINIYPLSLIFSSQCIWHKINISLSLFLLLDVINLNIKIYKE